MTIPVRVFVLKTFHRWAKGVLSDATLRSAANEVLSGAYEADLGGGVCKKRVALAGRGKSGSARTLIALHCEAGIFFLAGRLKSDPGADFSEPQVEAAKILARKLKAVTGPKLDELMAAGWIKEVLDATKERG